MKGRQKPNTVSNEEENPACDVQLMKFNSDYELAKTDMNIDFDDVLGSGNFGTVYNGEAKGTRVAIKKPHTNCPKATFKCVLIEIKILCYLGVHPNVVEFIGAYVKELSKGIVYMATELCVNGSLEDYLRTKTQVVTRNETTDENRGVEGVDSICYQDLNRMCIEIARGMEYIESKRVVHGDLAARNVLIDENYTCKIGDFGLSRKLYNYQQYVKKSQDPLPWKWMAYESLTRMEFTSKSDVWSYGVTLFEIYSLGSAPYAGLNWSREFTDELDNGLRLPRPKFASEEIYEKMLDCWKLESKRRPTFAEIVEFFKKFFLAGYADVPI